MFIIWVGVNKIIKVVNVRTEKATHYVGRKSSYRKNYINHGVDFSFLGNPYPITTFCSRDQVINLYKTRFYGILDFLYKKELDELKELSKTQDIFLGCFCHPKPCHANVIKEYLENE